MLKLIRIALFALLTLGMAAPALGLSPYLAIGSRGTFAYGGLGYGFCSPYYGFGRFGFGGIYGSCYGPFGGGILGSSYSPYGAFSNPYSYGGSGFGDYSYGYSNPYATYSNPYVAADQAGDPGSARQGKTEKDSSVLFRAAGLPAHGDRLIWPLGLRILPGAAYFRVRLEGLVQLAAARALDGAPTESIANQTAEVIRDFRRHLAEDERSRVSLNLSMYREANHYLDGLQAAMTFFGSVSESKTREPSN
ncbi:MAG: hypothetical protein FJ271_23690 [Planctomycetes bacterium]|nr:hypothetical protein [Planctomycetota bacterium]